MANTTRYRITGPLPDDGALETILPHLPVSARGGAVLAEHSAVNRQVAGSSPAGGAPRGHLTCIYRCRSDGRFRTRSSKVTINSPLIRSTGITNHGAIHRRSSLWMSPPTSHVLALCHRRVRVLQNVSGHPC